MPIPIPAVVKPLKIEVTAQQAADLEVIAARHYEANKADYEAAKAAPLTRAEVASALLGDAIAKELRPARSAKRG